MIRCGIAEVAVHGRDGGAGTAHFLGGALGHQPQNLRQT
jgi:hypothetical protein